MNDLTIYENQTNVQSQNNAREMKEVEAAIVLAKRFPRDSFQALRRIKDSCKRKKLAQGSMYAYPRGGQTVTGPSIRLAEEIARNWGNLTFGIKEVEQQDGYSLVEAFCWDYETNVRQVKQFKVEHVRYTRSAGKKKLVDPRDIYEAVANQGARRLRACILGVIPLDVIEEAIDECQKTLTNANDTPIADRIRAMLDAFSKFQVTQEMIEKRLNHTIDITSEIELVDLIKIHNSMRDGMSKRNDWFEFDTPQESAASDKLNSIGDKKETQKEK